MEKNISYIIHNLLEVSQLSQSGLAKELGISPPLIVHWMNGYREPSVSQCYRFIRLAKKYNIDLNLEMLKPDKENDVDFD